MSEYAERNERELGEHYFKHVSAMTGEGLHSKAAIAAELAYRDERIEQLTADRKDAIEALKMAMRLIYKAEMGNCMLYTPDINYLEQALTKLKTTKDE